MPVPTSTGPHARDTERRACLPRRPARRGGLGLASRRCCSCSTDRPRRSRGAAALGGGVAPSSLRGGGAAGTARSRARASRSKPVPLSRPRAISACRCSTIPRAGGRAPLPRTLELILSAASRVGSGSSRRVAPFAGARRRSPSVDGASFNLSMRCSSRARSCLAFAYARWFPRRVRRVRGSAATSCTAVRRSRSRSASLRSFADSPRCRDLERDWWTARAKASRPSGPAPHVVLNAMAPCSPALALTWAASGGPACR